MNFGKYQVVGMLEYHFELEPEWYWNIRPVTSGDDLVMAQWYVNNSNIIMVDGKPREQPPLWMEVMYKEIALLFGGTNIPKEEKKKEPILKEGAKEEDVIAVLKQMPETMVEEIWRALGETNPFWGPRTFQPTSTKENPKEQEAGETN
jgi:hypothetical protein